MIIGVPISVLYIIKKFFHLYNLAKLRRVYRKKDAKNENGIESCERRIELIETEKICKKIAVYVRKTIIEYTYRKIMER